MKLFFFFVSCAKRYSYNAMGLLMTIGFYYDFFRIFVNTLCLIEKQKKNELHPYWQFDQGWNEFFVYCFVYLSKSNILTYSARISCAVLWVPTKAHFSLWNWNAKQWLLQNLDIMHKHHEGGPFLASQMIIFTDTKIPLFL